jgi:hypothetical protein
MLADVCLLVLEVCFDVGNYTMNKCPAAVMMNLPEFCMCVCWLFLLHDITKAIAMMLMHFIRSCFLLMLMFDS